ncbi:MAG: hypothetical protein COV48_05760 [Elusimicrobia bacterium CG11_big_fil_rev_8_21_14_0_20_64_6]|nr:MAG: hypothetical protein COV48_05760 [Elusimicrobia bacterium CG11_big_fil_rev_8_21_14_0_20_64_6]
MLKPRPQRKRLLIITPGARGVSGKPARTASSRQRDGRVERGRRLKLRGGRPNFRVPQTAKIRKIILEDIRKPELLRQILQDLAVLGPLQLPPSPPAHDAASSEPRRRRCSSLNKKGNSDGACR